MTQFHFTKPSHFRNSKQINHDTDFITQEYFISLGYWGLLNPSLLLIKLNKVCHGQLILLLPDCQSCVLRENTDSYYQKNNRERYTKANHRLNELFEQAITV